MYQQILNQLERFEGGQLSDDGMEKWLLANLQHILDSKDQRAIALANELDALFIDESEALLSHGQVLIGIASLLEREKGTVWIGDSAVHLAGSDTVVKYYPDHPRTFSGLPGVPVLR